MIFLLLSILSSSLIFVIFKLFDRYRINTLQAIIFNYFIACSVGLLLDDQTFDLSRILSEGWFPGTIFLGFLFLCVFNLAAITTQRSGLSVVSVATKMSVAIPVLFGIFLYGETTGVSKIAGIGLALLAVYLTSIKKQEGIAIKKKNLIPPLLVFLGSGIIDTTIKYLETRFVSKTDVALFSSTIFVLAGAIGIFFLLFQKFSGTLEITRRNIVGGVILGVPNFFSIYFLVLALRTEGYESSTIFPINNVSIVMISTFLGMLIFQEKLIHKNWVRIGLAVLSILMIANFGS